MPLLISGVRRAQKLHLTLLRDGVKEPIIVELTRRKIDVPSVTLTWVGGDSDIARIKVSEFGSDTKKEWNDVVAQILGNSKTRGVIVDLRNNPGGYMQAAIDLAGDFVEDGSTVVIQQNGDGSKHEYKSSSLPRLKKYKTVVLINEGSASGYPRFLPEPSV